MVQLGNFLGNSILANIPNAKIGPLVNVANIELDISFNPDLLPRQDNALLQPVNTEFVTPADRLCY